MLTLSENLVSHSLLLKTRFTTSSFCSCCPDFWYYDFLLLSLLDMRTVSILSNHTYQYSAMPSFYACIWYIDTNKMYMAELEVIRLLQSSSTMQKIMLLQSWPQYSRKWWLRKIRLLYISNINIIRNPKGGKFLLACPCWNCSGQWYITIWSTFTQLSQHRSENPLILGMRRLFLSYTR